MKPSLEFIRKVCLDVIQQIDSGCEDDSGLEIFATAAQDYLDRNKHLNSFDVASELRIGYSTLTKYIREGIISPGIKEKGKLPYWIKSKVKQEYQKYVDEKCKLYK